ncbi:MULTISPECIES: hypothetical protein [Streptomyces]|uniref:Uncharacterized protein n=1 Tax=Streptomyces solicathayae TaxID=3081768 RepID=A0ABZ0LKI3_9ACTN|nr:hypothetical protein [Streptomyces sp. HUAS YS2]WOX19927.1 hypothetical protein R2D22_00305 [Streptomyces sp. HUAS YS2]
MREGRLARRQASLYGTGALRIGLLALPAQPVLMFHRRLITYLLTCGLCRCPCTADGSDTSDSRAGQGP